MKNWRIGCYVICLEFSFSKSLICVGISTELRVKGLISYLVMRWYKSAWRKREGGREERQ